MHKNPTFKHIKFFYNHKSPNTTFHTVYTCYLATVLTLRLQDEYTVTEVINLLQRNQRLTKTTASDSPSKHSGIYITQSVHSSERVKVHESRSTYS